MEVPGCLAAWHSLSLQSALSLCGNIPSNSALSFCLLFDNCQRNKSAIKTGLVTIAKKSLTPAIQTIVKKENMKNILDLKKHSRSMDISLVFVVSSL